MNNLNESFDLQEYLTKGVEGVIADAIIATLKKTRIYCYLWSHSTRSHSCRHGGSMFLRYPDIYHSVRKAFRLVIEACTQFHCSCNRDNPGIFF